jgi:hypothetical protein
MNSVLEGARQQGNPLIDRQSVPYIENGGARNNNTFRGSVWRGLETLLA